MVERQIAKKTRIADLTKGKFFAGGREEDQFRASYVITPFGEKVSRANIVASVIDIFVNAEGSYASITLDDGTNAIQSRVFGADVSIFEGIHKGDMVIVVGKMKEYQNQIYVQAELVRKVEPSYENLRRLEILENLSNRKRIIDNIRRVQTQLSEDELKEYTKRLGIDEEALQVVMEKKEADYKPQILEIIGSLGDENGIEITRLFEIVKLPDSVVETTIDELLAEGSIYEPLPGKFKKIE